MTSSQMDLPMDFGHQKTAPAKLRGWNLGLPFESNCGGKNSERMECSLGCPPSSKDLDSDPLLNMFHVILLLGRGTTQTGCNSLPRFVAFWWHFCHLNATNRLLPSSPPRSINWKRQWSEKCGENEGWKTQRIIHPNSFGTKDGHEAVPFTNGCSFDYKILLMAKIRRSPVEVGSLPHYL